MGATVQRENVIITAVRRPGFTKEILTAAEKAEATYSKTDASVVEAENRRNDFETHVFKLREIIGSKDPLLTTYASLDEQKTLAADLEEAEAWTYEHTEEEAQIYADRLKALSHLERECANRKATLESMDEKVKALKSSIKRYKATANSSIYEYIAKEKRDSITKECDMNTEWLGGLEKKQAALQKWESPVISGAEVALRSSNLTRNSTKILSEPRPKPPEPEKDEKDGKKKKNKKGDKDGKDKDGEKRDSNAAEDVGAEVDAGEDACKPVEAPKRPKWQLFLGVGIAILTVLLGGAICAGYGKRYGVDSPMAWWTQEDADFDDMPLHDLADPESSDMAEELVLDEVAADESLADEPAVPVADGEEEL